MSDVECDKCVKKGSGFEVRGSECFFDVMLRSVSTKHPGPSLDKSFKNYMKSYLKIEE